MKINNDYQKIESVSKAIMDERNKIIRSHQQGVFFKQCPGTGEGYLCCGYQIITPLTGCGMYCSYCVLQEYHRQQHHVLFDNFNDLELEVRNKLDKRKGIVRIGTGEFADSLYLEPELGICRKIATLLEPYDNVLVEFKTKSTNINELSMIRNPKKVTIGFSLNTDYVVSCIEQNTAPIKDRISAAERCIEMGFSVAFHFDPMIWYPNWEHDYRKLVDDVFSGISQPAKIVWWSMGGFRTMHGLKKRLRLMNRHLPLFSGEMVHGGDGKIRYFRPIRVAFYRAVLDQAKKYYSDVPLYLCMESADIWRDSGLDVKIPNGIASFLDSRAKTILHG